MPKYRLLTGLSYPDPAGVLDPETRHRKHPETGRRMEKRAEAGETVDDLDPKSVPWLLEAGHIEEVTGGVAVPGPAEEPAPKKEKAKKEEKPS